MPITKNVPGCPCDCGEDSPCSPKLTITLRDCNSQGVSGASVTVEGDKGDFALGETDGDGSVVIELEGRQVYEVEIARPGNPDLITRTIEVGCEDASFVGRGARMAFPVRGCKVEEFPNWGFGHLRRLGGVTVRVEIDGWTVIGVSDHEGVVWVEAVCVNLPVVARVTAISPGPSMVDGKADIERSSFYPACTYPDPLFTAGVDLGMAPGWVCTCSGSGVPDVWLYSDDKGSAILYPALPSDNGYPDTKSWSGQYSADCDESADPADPADCGPGVSYGSGPLKTKNILYNVSINCGIVGRDCRALSRQKCPGPGTYPMNPATNPGEGHPGQNIITRQQASYSLTPTGASGAFSPQPNPDPFNIDRIPVMACPASHFTLSPIPSPSAEAEPSPSLLSKAASFALAVASDIRHGFQRLPSEAVEHRLAVCQRGEGLRDDQRASDGSCNRYDAEKEACGSCGCRLTGIYNLAERPDLDCPLGRWPKPKI